MLELIVSSDMDIAIVARRVADAILEEQSVDLESWNELRRVVTDTLKDSNIPNDFELDYIPRTDDLMEQFYVTHSSHHQKFTVNIWGSGDITVYDVPDEHACCMVTENPSPGSF